jgi:large subunit ribosomal protein L39
MTEIWFMNILFSNRSESGSKVAVYRMGDHVDITAGPLISSTGQLGRFTVTAVSRS